jgi:uroporphyrinogen-III decarboxylase
VFNLGHGMLPQADPSRVEALVDEVRGYDRHAPDPAAGAAT